MLACLMVLIAWPALAAHWIEEPVGPLETFIRDRSAPHRLAGTRLGVATAGGTTFQVERSGGGDFWNYRVVLSRASQRIVVEVSQMQDLQARPGRLVLVNEGAHGEQAVVTLVIENGRIVAASGRHDGPRRLFHERTSCELDIRLQTRR